MVVGMAMRTYLSIQHLRSAAYFCRRAIAEEASYDGDLQSPQLSVILAYSSSTLFLSVAFLEGMINELFADARLPPGQSRLDTLQVEELAQIAAIGTDDYLRTTELLKKYKSFLTSLGKAPIGTGCAPGQHVKYMVELRNHLFHYKGPWLDMATENMSRPGSFRSTDLFKAIIGKFEPRAHAKGHSGDYWLGAGCAAWALRSALSFADQFFEELGVLPTFDHIRDELVF